MSSSYGESESLPGSAAIWAPLIHSSTVVAGRPSTSTNTENVELTVVPGIGLRTVIGGGAGGVPGPSTL